MKKLIALLLALILCFSMFACGQAKESEDKDDEKIEQKEEVEETAAPTEAPTEPEPTEPPFNSSNEYFSLDGIYVDSTYSEEEGSPVRTVYLFYTLTAPETNLEIDSNYTQLTINDANTYQSENYLLGDYATSYYASSYIEDVYVGTSLKVLATFKIPETDLAPGRVITLSDTQIPDLTNIRISTDDVQFMEGELAICEAADPEGYAQALFLREEADEDTAKKVRKGLTGYYWSFYANNIYYEIEFYKKSKYELRTAYGTADGTYVIANGYLICTHNSNGYVAEIPWEFNEDGELILNPAAAFDVYS